jgi:hypothetical protein
MGSTARISEVKPERKMIEQQEPKFHQWTHENEQIEGHLLAMESFELIDKNSGELKNQIRYVVRDPDKNLISFLQTVTLARLLRKEHIGHYVVVTYAGEDRSVKTQGSPLRRFRVRTSELKEMDPELGF